MADTTPTTGFLGGKCMFTWGSNTYHGITNYGWSGAVEQQVLKFSGSSGTVTARIAGDENDADDTFTLDIIVGPGDSATIDALKRGSTETTCELHPEGNTAGNIEFVAEAAVITNSSFSGSISDGGVLSISVGVNGTLTIQEAAA